jgi:hypothetical protein
LQIFALRGVVREIEAVRRFLLNKTGMGVMFCNVFQIISLDVLIKEMTPNGSPLF